MKRRKEHRDERSSPINPIWIDECHQQGRHQADCSRNDNQGPNLHLIDQKTSDNISSSTDENHRKKSEGSLKS